MPNYWPESLSLGAKSYNKIRKMAINRLGNHTGNKKHTTWVKRLSFKSFHICAAWAPLVLTENSTAILEERGSFGATWTSHVRHVLIPDKFEVQFDF